VAAVQATTPQPVPTAPPAGSAAGWSKTVRIAPPKPSPFKPYFTKGLVADQGLAARLRAHQHHVTASGASDGVTLGTRADHHMLSESIHTPGDVIRADLAGSLRLALLQLLDEARRDATKVYAALFNLTDYELTEKLLALGDKLNIVLANGTEGDAERRLGTAGGNRDDAEASRRALKRAAPSAPAIPGAPRQVVDRLLDGHLGHNKFVVFCDSSGNAAKVWTSSANWTRTGLCTQTNNALLIEIPQVADVFLDYWKELAQAGGEMTAQLRAFTAVPHRVPLGGAKEVTLWFAPVPAPTAPSTLPPPNPALMPDDLVEVTTLIKRAKKAILFLLFKPALADNAGSAWDAILARMRDQARPIFVRGVINNWPDQAPPEAGVAHSPSGMTAPIDAPPIIIPDAFDDLRGEVDPELPSFSDVIVHDKLIVIDPFESDPVVITGAHNLGPTASVDNDENMVIVKGVSSVARAYALHVGSVYDHYRVRYVYKRRRYGA
ncbi:MAG TPA: hypothetical protein VFX49_03770, partial [Chloroflexota bacterium]|nr:hypothetical protein [Chloroflexota bacterium]